MVEMSNEQLFCLRWNNFQTNFTAQFETLRAEEDFVDVTLACEGKRIKAHKLILSACSPYFKELFKCNPCKHPIIFMQDVEYEHLLSLVEFMYSGEVNIAQAQLPNFLHTAECLQIRGLTAALQKKKSTESEKISNSKTMTLFSNENNTKLKNQSRTNESNSNFENNLDERLPPSKKICRSSDQAHHSRDPPLSIDGVESKPGPLLQPKTEPIEYFSDDEIKTETSPRASADFMSEGHSSYSMQGSTDTSVHHNQFGESSQENTQGSWPNRRYSQTLNETNTRNFSSNRVSLGFGVEVRVDQLRGVKWNDYRKLTRGLASILFSHQELATRSVTGQRWSRYFSAGDARPVKPALDPAKIHAIIGIYL
uniref:BTB domain-containing protein n=1 Tax=Clastoptera arizonana TaxID=38151 RepID=A0A1B6DIU8_9HEMI